MAIDYDDPAVIQDAKEKLAEMYSRADRQGRIDIGRLLTRQGRIPILLGGRRRD